MNSSGWVSSDLTDRIVALRAGSVRLTIVDSFCTSYLQKRLMIFRKALKVCAYRAGDLF